MTTLLDSCVVYHKTNARYAIYRLLSVNNEEEIKWGVMSRSGLINLSTLKIKSGLVSGKTFTSRDAARKRYQVLLESAKRRGFVENKHIQHSYTPDIDWQDMNQNMERRKNNTYKQASSIDKSNCYTLVVE